MKKKARGLFDEQFRLDKISNQNDPLVKLQQHIDFEIFRKPLEKHFESGKDKSVGGRPSFDYLMMFKIVILQRYYNLSDDSTEYAILDRLSFMRFLGLTISDSVPDAKTIWNFKNELAKARLIEVLFNLLDKTLTKRGVILNKGQMIDASIVEVPIQRNSREENEQLKQGQLPENWKDHKAKLNQKDVDAKWAIQKGKSYYGYKDKAYYKKEIEQLLERKGIISKIHMKGYRYVKLTAKQITENTRKSRIRARVEHIFGFMSNSMNRMYIRCRSLVKASVAIGLMNITYNLFRITQLKVNLNTR